MCPAIEGNREPGVPSRGENPPLKSNSRSQSCLSLRTMEGSFSASAARASCLGKSRASRSLVICQYPLPRPRDAGTDLSSPPWGGFAIMKREVSLYRKEAEGQLKKFAKEEI